MKRQIIIRGILAFSLLALVGLTAPTFQSVHADTGPHPSVTVTFEGMDDVATYYVAPLGLSQSGPHVIIDDDSQLSEYWRTPTDIDARMMAYTDPDGYRYTSYFYNTCHNEDEVTWGYYPFSPFKILIYEPISQAYAVSEARERLPYLNSYFTYTIDGDAFESAAPGALLTMTGTVDVTAYRVGEQAWALIGRVLLTLLLELGLAILVGIRYPRQLVAIGLTNIVTQLMLNIGLNLVYMISGPAVYYIGFFVGEILVTLTEALFYVLYFRQRAQKDTHYVTRGLIAYAIGANMISAFVGLLISMLLSFGPL